ncbi:MAG: hypothetical protein FWB85_09670 [Chitinispirillia bacterium]|nr:hypothetical protein [Chitinispirillia bacterium]MCL2242448.1 hypothetical protein [Chitinispirillia bacterium]
MTAAPKVHRPTAATLLTLAALAVIAAGCAKTAVRKDVDTVQTATAIRDTVGGTFTDLRDGKAYRTVKIGSQTWMAENLNFATDSSACYDNVESNCQKYGRLYNWNDAMKACPAGWRLPTDEDGDILALAVGGWRDEDGDWKIAGEKLKSKNGWCNSNYRSCDSAADEFGFSALPAGGYHYSGFEGAGRYGFWWSATDTDAHGAWYWSMNIYSYWVEGRNYSYKASLYSVRCRQDSAADTALAEQAIPDTAGWTVTDPRDGKTYRTVRIGNRRTGYLTWMAENLNFETGSSRCYGDDTSNCQKYGRLYNWTNAMKACPAGWRVPSDEEWDKLAVAAGGKPLIGISLLDGWAIAGKKLKSENGWAGLGEDSDGNPLSGNGTNEFGFSALPGGSGWHHKACGCGRDKTWSHFSNADSIGAWWSATTSDFTAAAYRRMYYSHNSMDRSFNYKSALYSVRCVWGPADLR